MAGKYSWIALFVVLQISTVLCRSTEKPNDEVNLALVGHKLSPQGQASLSKNGEDPTPESPLPSEMPNEVYNRNKVQLYIDYYNQDVTLSAVAIFFIVYAVFIFLSFALGCILYFQCKKPPRRGYIVNSNTSGNQQPVTTM